MKRSKILLFYSDLTVSGGATGVAAWMLQALRDTYEVTLLTWQRIQLDKLNTVFGTSLREGDFSLKTVPWPIRKLIELDPDRGSIQRHAWLMRVAKRMRPAFDLVVSADNEADFGQQPALQYIHVPSLAHVQHGTRFRPWRLVSGFSFDRMKANRTLVNSDWTGRWVKREYGIETITVNPPACGDYSEVPWNQREDGFVMVGRFTPAKRPHWAIDLLRCVRDTYPNIQLHLVGTVSSYPGDRGYFEFLQPVLRENKDWVTLHRDMPRNDLTKLLVGQRYGIHAFENEHFGMSVAEMVAAGCIPFVHDSGGPPDTIGGDPRLLYSEAGEAITKIKQVIADPEAQRDIIDRLALRRRAFHPEIFMESFRREVQIALSTDDVPCPPPERFNETQTAE